MSEKNLKIALVSDAFGHSVEGDDQIITNGTVKFTSQLAHVAGRYDAKVQLMTTSPSYAGIDDGSISILPMERLIFPNLPLTAQTHGGVAIEGIRKSLDDFQPDIVSLSTIGAPNANVAQRWAQEREVPIVATMHSHPGKLVEHTLSELEVDSYGIDKFMAETRRRILHSVSALKAIIVRSHRSQSELEDWGIRGNFHILKGGIDKSTYRPATSTDEVLSIRNRYGIEPNAFVVLFVGRFCPAKESEAVLKTYRGAKQVNDSVKLVVVGNHSYYVDEVKSLIEEGVVFFGEMQPEEVANVMRAANIGIAPSTHETFGQAIAEMMASGLACVLPDEGGHRSFASPNSSILLPVFNPESEQLWVDAVLKLLQVSEMRQQISRLARLQIYDVDDSFKDFIRIHRLIVSQSTNALLVG